MARDLKDLFLAILDETERLEDLQSLLDLWIEDFDNTAGPKFPKRLGLLLEAYRAAAKESFVKLQANLDEMQKML